MNPRIKEVSTTDGYQLNLLFTNGERGIYDCSNILDFEKDKGTQTLII